MPNSIRSNSIKRWTLAEWLERQWYRVGIWHILLLPLSWTFFLASTCRRLAYQSGLFRSYRAPVPLIVVGNISVGGTGKTPLVIWLAEQLKQAGFSPGIISRGYGGRSCNPLAVAVNGDPLQFGDEPVLLARRAACPVWVGQDRVAVQQALLQAHPECNVIVSDDGLQHYRMRRDIELVLVDAERKFGNGYLIPAGPLREPVSRLKQVDAVIYNGRRVGNSSDFCLELKAGEMRNVLDAGKTTTAATLSSQKVHAVAGIGNPQRFFRQLAGMGLHVEAHVFADHHRFQPDDFQDMQDGVVLMTEKDAVKCTGFAKPDWWYLPVDAVVDEALADYIFSIFKKPETKR